MRIDVVTLFPEMFEPVLGASIMGRARARGLLVFGTVNPGTSPRIGTGPWMTVLSGAAPGWS